MTTTIIAANYINTGTTSYALGAGEDLLVAAGVTVGYTHATAVNSSTGGNVVDVLGTLSGAYSGLWLDASDGDVGNYRVYVGPDGALLAENGDALNLHGSGSSVVNEGLIRGGYGFYASGDTVRFANYGTVIGTTWDAIYVHSSGGEVLNYGRVHSESTSSSDCGVDLWTDGDGTVVTLRNFGEISAMSGVAINASDGADVLDNAGTVVGDVIHQGGDDQHINRGVIWGDVDLGEGGDRYDGRGGRVEGDVRGGAGSDWLRGGDGDDRLFGAVDDDTLLGGAGEDALDGGDGNDQLRGGVDDDALAGGPGSDWLDGGAGADALVGGAGADQYRVDDRADTITELANEGSDRVETALAFTLGANVEALTLIGLSAVNGTGNGLANTLTGNGANNVLTGLGGADRLVGNAGNDRLVGGAGNDTLNGGMGRDIFRFDTALNASTNVDRIIDFVGVDDTIQLENAVFNALTATGPLALDEFRSVVSGGATAGVVGTVHLIYDRGTGNLYYDTNGGDATGRTLFATLAGDPDGVTAADFVVT